MKYLTLDEQKQLTKTVWSTKHAERDATIIELFLNSGLRVSEMAGLLVGDVRNKQRLFVRPEIAKRKQRKTPDGKPRTNSRTVPLNVATQDMLHVWLSMKLGTLHESIEDGAPLFITRLGAALPKRSIENIVEKWMIRAGITTMRNGKVVALYSVHALRHTYAMRARERGVDLETIQDCLGHATLASTGVYVKTTDAKKDEMARRVGMSYSRASRLNKMREAI